ncbi:MAG: hypothetical protein AABW89_02330 [Nanoarchaeota archaeon]
MKTLSKKEVAKRIEDYFSKDKLDSLQTKKIKNLAMANQIRLKDHRKRFCRKCFEDLRLGKIRVSERYKTIVCGSCNYKNRFKLS